MFSWAAWPSSQGMPARPFALGVAPTDLARPGDGAAGPAAPLSQEQKSERGEDATPPRGTATLSLRAACASLGLGRPRGPAPRPSPLLPGADALSCQKDELVVTKPLLVSGSPVPWPRTRDAWPPPRASRSVLRVLSAVPTALCTGARVSPVAAALTCRAHTEQGRPAARGSALPPRSAGARAPGTVPAQPRALLVHRSPRLGEGAGRRGSASIRSDALGVVTSPQAPLYCHQLPPGVARDCQGQLAPGCAPGLWPPAMALGVPQHV